VTSSEWLSVTRDEATTTCPEAVALRRAVERLVDEPVPHPKETVEVRFAFEAGQFVARLGAGGTRAETRELRDRNADCKPLAQAVVTALALWLEAETETPLEEELAVTPLVADNPSAAPTESLAPIELPAAEPAPSSGPRLSLGGQVGVGAGWGAAPGLLLGAQLALELSYLRLGLGAQWLPSQTERVPPGEIDVELRTLSVQACGRFFQLGPVDAWGCSGLWGGTLSAAARGYTSDSTRAEPWFAVPVELMLSGNFFPRARWAAQPRLGATLLIPTRHQTFSIEGIGTVVDPDPVAVWFWLGIDLSLGL
jgi:hypothetical protein